MTHLVTVDRAMERGVAMGRYCQHCGCEFATEIGAKASCTTCNNERIEAKLPPHSNVRPREDELNVAAHKTEARKRRERNNRVNGVYVSDAHGLSAAVRPVGRYESCGGAG